jgi:hypothetical protein
MANDTRGFRYSLEPLQQRRGWQFDAAMAKVAAARKRVSDAQARERQVQDDVVAQATFAAGEWSLRLDPAAHSRSLAYLLQLQQRKARITLEITVLQEELTMAQKEATRLQQGVETLQRHRAEVLDAYRAEQERKSTAQADQDWSAREALAAGDAR